MAHKEIKTTNVLTPPKGRLKTNAKRKIVIVDKPIPTINDNDNLSNKPILNFKAKVTCKPINNIKISKNIVSIIIS